jgi:hypothetical protein
VRGNTLPQLDSETKIAKSKKRTNLRDAKRGQGTQGLKSLLPQIPDKSRLYGIIIKSKKALNPFIGLICDAEIISQTIIKHFNQ